MAPSVLFNAFAALAALAFLAPSFLVAPVNALSQSHNVALQARGHDAFTKRKRSTGLNRRCKANHPPALQQQPTSSHTSHHAAQTHQSSGSSGSSGSNTPSYGGGGSSDNKGGKVGLAWAGDDSQLANFKSPRVSHFYNWSPNIPQKAKDLGFVPMPMLWGDRQIGEFQRVVKPGYAHIVLGFNEPNEPGQSNMSPEHGAYLWKTYLQPLKNQGYSLISPATSSNPNGMVWMKNFFQACDGCTFDGVAVHWYDVGAQKFIDYLKLWHDAFGLPIWPTEFACQNFNGGAQCSQGEVYSFMSTVTNFMDNTPWVANYFAFGMMTNMQGVNPANQLMAGNGHPTDLGWQYMNGS